MSRLLFGNFHFEHELASSTQQTLPAALTRLNAEFAPLLIPLADDGDAIWFPELIDPGFLSAVADVGLPRVVPASAPFFGSRRLESRQLEPHLPAETPSALPMVPTRQLPEGGTPTIRSDGSEAGLTHDAAPFVVQPWGWSKAFAHEARHRHWRIPDGINFEATAQANGRRFSFEQEAALDVLTLGACRVTSLPELERAIRTSAQFHGANASDHRWCLKAEFSMSARERIVATGLNLTASSSGWIRRRFARGETLYFEPWLDRVAEFSTHWNVSTDGVEFVGIVQLLNDNDGQFLGVTKPSFETANSQAEPGNESHAGIESHPLLAGIVAAGEAVATAIRRIGGTGPLGIDAMLYRDSTATLRSRPVQDINFRWTMGRIGLTLMDRLVPAQQAAWLLLKADQCSRLFDAAKLETTRLNVRLLRTSPLLVGSRSAKRVAVLLSAPDGDELDCLVQQLSEF